MATVTTVVQTCKQCAKPFDKGAHCVGCEGFCSDFFHIECIQFTLEELVCYRKLTNVWWICEGCRTIMKEMKSCRSISVPGKELSSHPPEVPTRLDVVDKEVALKEQIAEIQNTLANVSFAHTTRTSDAVIEDVPQAQSSMLSSSHLMYGTRNTVHPTGSSTDSRIPGGKYWIFFTKIKNCVTELDMRKMTINCLGTDDVVVKKLVPAWKDARSMPFISFKVGIGVQFKEVAQCSSTWPTGLCFREFRDNVWEPPQHDRGCTL